jgi:dUTP pyrophosphatase
MTIANATSPPTSPPAKRVKSAAGTNEQSIAAEPAANGSIDTTMADSNGTAVPVTKVEQAPALLIKKLSEKARLPTRGSAFAAGYDLYASKDTVVPARGKVLVDTDLSMAVPAGTCKSRAYAL